MLSLEFGIPVSELSQRMTAAEETMWMAYHRDQPIGPNRVDAALAQIAQLLFNTQVKKQDRKPLTDFMLFYRKPAVVQENVSDNVRSFFGKLTKRK